MRRHRRPDRLSLMLVEKMGESRGLGREIGILEKSIVGENTVDDVLPLRSDPHRDRKDDRQQVLVDLRTCHR